MKQLLNQLLLICFLISPIVRCDMNTIRPMEAFAFEKGIDEQMMKEISRSVEATVPSGDRRLQTAGICSEFFYEELFADQTFPDEDYISFEGLDFNALLAGSVALSDNFAVIGSNGFNIYQGLVHVYERVSDSEWQLQQYIRTPTHANANFGEAVAIDSANERIVISANAYNLYDGIIFVYDFILNSVWEETATITSSLARINSTQGFGYRVDISGDFIIASTAVNNAYIFQLINDEWVLAKDLEPPSDDARFGRSVAIHNDFAVVGAYGVGESAGAAFVYKKNDADVWEFLQVLPSINGYSSYFGWSVDVFRDTIIVGAPGFRANLFQPRGERIGNNTGSVYIYSYNETADSFLTNNITEIVSPVGPDSSFGVSVALDSVSAMVGADGFPCGSTTGGAFLFTQKTDGGWDLNAFYPSPAGENGHFGFSVDVSSTFSAIGAYGYENLQGSIYLAIRNPVDFTFSPSEFPTSYPTAAPSLPNVGEALTIGDENTIDTDNELELGLLVALFLAVLLAAGAAGTCLWCCCCIVAPIAGKKKKKKKEEEENSPYTVHSYRGYSEADEYAYSDTSETITDSQYTRPLPMPMLPMKKEKSVKFMDDEALRRQFPYKVYGPRGYATSSGEMSEEELLRMKAEMYGKKPEEYESPTNYAPSPYAAKLAQMDMSQPPYPSYMPPAAGQDVHNKRRVPSYHSSYSSRSLGSAASRDSDGSYSTYVMDDDTVYTEGDDSRRDSHADDASYVSYSNQYPSGGSGDESSHSGADSLVEQARLRGQLLKETGKLPTDSDATGTPTGSSLDKSRLVEEARAKYRAMRDVQPSTTASSSSFIEEARARRRLYSGTTSTNEDSSYHRTNLSTNHSLTSGIPSHMQQQSVSDHAKGHDPSTGTSSQWDNDDQSVHSYHSSGSSSLVSTAKARYAELQRAAEKASGAQASASNAPRSRQDDESVGSSGSRSLVDAARQRYADIQKQQDESASQRSSESSERENLVNRAKARYEAYRAQKVKMDTNPMRSASLSKSADEEPPMSSESASTEISSPEQRAISAREAAMSKFAMFKAKAEQEARSRAEEEARMRDALAAERAAAEEEEKRRTEEDARIEAAVAAAEARADAASYDNEES